MSRIEDFLLQDEQNINETRDIYISKRFKDSDGNLIPFKIKAITEEEHKSIKRAATKTEYNKKTHQQQKELDSVKYVAGVVVACTVEPNLKSAALQNKHGCEGDPEALINKLLQSGEYNLLTEAIWDINGFLDDINDLAEEAKN